MDFNIAFLMAILDRVTLIPTDLFDWNSGVAWTRGRGDRAGARAEN